MSEKSVKLICLLLLLMCLPLHAQKTNGGFIWGELLDNFTRESLVGAKVTLLTADSVVVDSIEKTSKGACVNNVWGAWYFEVPKKMEKSIVKFEYEGYETCYLDIPAMTFSGRNSMKRFDGYARRIPRSRLLGEATVTATKVKFYMKKDTLVFNADAFQLAEGSMLDALISQLPGAELKDDGRILINGRQVESLLLNGEDFFKGNNRMMLDNLPSYMVQNVQVYEKQGDIGKMMGRKVGDEQYVMDVKLKKQYSIGWIANAETGYSTEDHYLGRLFALRFTPQSRITVVGNINNVNDTRRPGQNSEWTPNNMPSGTLTTRMLAADYMVKDKYRHYELSGSADVDHSDAANLTRKASETFLPDGNTFERSENRMKSHNVRVSTSHKFIFTPRDEWRFFLSPRFSYSRQEGSSAYAGATFLANPGEYATADLIDSIRKPQAGSLLRRLAVNRTLTESLNNSRRYQGGLSFSNIMKLGTDMIEVNGAVNGFGNRRNVFDHYLLDYPSNPSLAQDYRNRWTKGRPDRSLGYNVRAAYSYWPSGQWLVQPGYTFGQSHIHKDNTIYRLERLAGWGFGTDHPLGMLPSELEQLTSAIDGKNSYERRETETWHEVGVYIKDDHWAEKTGNYFHFDVRLPLTVTHNRFDYMRADYDRVTTRNTVFFQPSARVEYKWHGGKRSVSFNYNMRQSAPDMLDLLDIEDNEDPLNIYHGNPGLKNTTVHTLRFDHSNNSPRKQRTFGAYAVYNVTRNAKAMGYVYDRSTGVRNYRPENVNGNYYVYGGVNYSMPLDRKKRFTFSTSTFGQLFHGVDLISTEAGVAPSLSSVDTYWATETVRLDYRMGKLTFGAKAYCSWNRAASEREDFVPFTVWDFNYGPTVQVELPWNMQLVSDLTLYSRRGYDDPAANTDDVVWNARLSKRILKGGLTFSVDAFDILGQLSNLTQTVNSQGRFETFRDVTPRYVMFHVIYRLNIKPKARGI
ncbi:outer membrane beta-barrel protein [Xylanibacter rodentium]|uniref:outer membrane beta-barrel protein n=1 Tax=Xylanibacter rodentium TaxID=2736289 RepID=UPI002589CE7C|nr:outer membrane beta-barrel protein [Xylanibacter rodentium]